ncbi:hypothetical protein A3B56_03085 [Candidatus Roizmanbacteria bacterium RIFCSPLOWO2_01_FULL_45_11]|uniref:Uncharacterized protein n=1 Tax=Candidatus Roizmanbacteria bacterium RIFCSPLOWO2_01_FULL_45_11 TaxID=1802070 RepID=A0A1F7JHZ2_9BACT|nr:MAG: hypothetical protein A3B56_03085 [Candidatus Roizmanbacteria bacterium RIFCSPLOWO2_01_FULL_45_11]
MINDFAIQFQELEKTLASKKGDFELFALFLREGSPDKWDLILAAPWIKQEESADLREIAQKIQTTLSKEDLLKLSRIILIDKKTPMLSTLNRSVDIAHGIVEVKDSNFFGLPIKHAYIFTSQKINKDKLKN